MTRLKSKSLNFIPVSINFSELQQHGEEIENIEESFSNKFENDREYELLICNMLYNLDSKEKVIFLLLILKNDGYQFDNNSIASLLGTKFKTYTNLVKRVKQKFYNYLQETHQLA